MADVQTLPAVTVTGTKDDTDYLTPVVTKAFASFGQDTNTPAVQAQVASAIARLRDTNPDADDKTLAQQVSNNLPSLISSVLQTKPVSSGVDEQGQLQQFMQQRQADADHAVSAANSAPNVWGKAPSIDPNAYTKSVVDNSFLQSNALGDNMKAVGTFYGNQKSKADAENAQQVAAQSGIKTIGDQQGLSQSQQMLDPNGTQASALRTALTQQLTQMGAPAASLAQMKTMNVPQLKMFADAFTTNEKERAAINLTTQQALTQKATQGQIGATTRGINLENVVKGVDAKVATKATDGYLNGAPGSASTLEGAPSGTFQKYGTAGQQSAFTANTKLLDGLNAGSSDRADTLAQIDQTLDLIRANPTGLTGPLRAKIDTQLQQITKNLAGLEAKQQLGQSTAAGSLAAAAASPDISKQTDTLRAYLANTKAALQRQESVNAALNTARTGNNLGSFDVNKEAGGTRSFVMPGGKIITFSPADIASGAANQVMSMGATPVVSYHGSK